MGFDVSTIDLCAPSRESLFEPVSVDGHLTLTSTVYEHVLRQAKRVGKRCRIELKIRIAHAGDLGPDVTRTAIHSHFLRRADFEKDLLKQSLRYGFVYLLIALSIVLSVSALVAFLKPYTGGNFLHGLSESLIIFGWVALWRPMDILLYDWIPVYRNIALLQRLAGAELEVVFDSTPALDLRGS